MKWLSFHLLPVLTTLYVSTILAYEVSISEVDSSRQFCSGMWTGADTFINSISSQLPFQSLDWSTLISVTFSQNSRGRVAVVIYEWRDVDFLGKLVSDDEALPVCVLHHDLSSLTSKAALAESLCLHGWRSATEALRVRWFGAIHHRLACWTGTQ